VGQPHGQNVYNRTSSGVMSREGIPEWTYYVFDSHTMPTGYFDRYEILHASQKYWAGTSTNIALLPQKIIQTLDELRDYEQEVCERGYEGLILRHPHSPYKQNRSTLREMYMLKLKRFVDREAKIVGFEELLRNANEATQDARGFTARSSHIANKLPADTLGALVVEDLENTDWCFNVGTGFDSQTRQEIWDHQSKYLGRTISYRYTPVGTLELPRHPVFKGFRSQIDLS